MMKRGFVGYLALFLRGICMGIADIIPGVSGGTIAFITGMYDELLESIKSFNLNNLKDLFCFRVKKALSNLKWKFLITLGFGIAVAFILLAHFFHHLLNHPFYSTFLYAFFLGLIIASILFCIKEIPNWKISHFGYLILGIAIAFVFTWSDPEIFYKEKKFIVPLEKELKINENLSLNNYNSEIHALTHISFSTLKLMRAKGILSNQLTVLDQKDLTPYELNELLGEKTKAWGINPWQIVCGIIAISAMLLPGISGSYLLTILGMYPVAIGALADLSSSIKSGAFDISSFSILANLFVGIVIGLVLFSRVISFLLKKYRGPTLALLIGFMIGALRSVWPFWQKSLSINPLKITQAPDLVFVQPIIPNTSESIFWISILCALAGLFLVMGIELISRKKLKPNLL